LTHNTFYVAQMKPHGLPPRTTVEVDRFLGGIGIEIEAVAHVRRQ
jgi:hypothetical protein